MNSYYYLYLPLLALPLILMLLRRVVLQNRIKQEWVILANMVLTYLIIIGVTFLLEQQSQTELMRFDLNGDGQFSGEEITADQQAAQAEHEKMSARTLAPATGAMFAFFYSALFYCLLILRDALFNRNQDD